MADRMTDLEPRYDAIQFLDGWTGRAFYLMQTWLCGPRTLEHHPRHATEAEAIACIKGEFMPIGSPESVAQRNRRTAETAPLAPGTPSGRSPRPVAVPDRLARQSALRATPAPAVPATRGHPASCKHQWCYCHNSEHIKDGGPCRRCKTDAFNRRDRE